MWKLSHPIVIKYLEGFIEPMAKMRAKYETSNDRGVNHCIKQSSLHQRLVLFVGSMVILIQNFIVEHTIMNDSLGMVKAILYESPNGPADKNALAKYVIVGFKQSTLSADEPTIEGAPSTWIYVPVVTNRCEKNCCLVSAIPI